MREVAKEQFKQICVELGGGKYRGWTIEYWNQFFENDERAGMKYLVEEPKTRKHTRMMIVGDSSTNEYRLFFLTEEDEEGFFDFPDYGEREEQVRDAGADSARRRLRGLVGEVLRRLFGAVRL